MRLIVVLGVVLLLAACGDDEGGGSADASAASELAGSTYTSTSVTGRELVDGAPLTLQFTDDGISANAGCNTMSATATWTDGTLEVDGDAMAMTQMACDDALMEQDIWLSEFLTSSPKLTAGDDELVLEGDGVTLTFEEQGP